MASRTERLLGNLRQRSKKVEVPLLCYPPPRPPSAPHPLQQHRLRLPLLRPFRRLLRPS